MLLSDAITVVLQRTGLTTSVDETRDNARRYLSMSTTELLSMDERWWWLDKTTTFTTTASDRTYTPIEAQVSAWYSFVDQSNDRALNIVGSNAYDLNDLDLSERSDAEFIYIAGLDASTGYPIIEIGPTPGTTGDTIRVRYRIDIPAFTSSNDSTDLSVLGLPKIAENCIIFEASSLYLDEQGDTESAGREMARYDRCRVMAVSQNRRMQGGRRFPPRRGGERPLARIDSTLITLS